LQIFRLPPYHWTMYLARHNCFKLPSEKRVHLGEQWYVYASQGRRFVEVEIAFSLESCTNASPVFLLNTVIRIISIFRGMMLNYINECCNQFIAPICFHLMR
jgi:hypothetical protein